MAIPDPIREKKHARTHFRCLLENLSEEDIRISSRRIMESCAKWLDQHPQFKRIALFSAMAGEPNLSELHQLLPERDFHYPLVTGPGTLQFHLVSSPDTLSPGKYGIREPKPLVHPPRPLEELEVFFCPGLAFGRNGVRLGRGGGFYDRLLTVAGSKPLRIGIGFPIQLVDELPFERHDVRMTHLAGIEEVARLS